MNQKDKTEWWSDRRFWEDFGPLMFDTDRLSDAAREVEGVVALTGVQAPARVLDVGCGPGRHAAELAARGFAVMGIDIQDSFLADARERCSGRVPAPEFQNLDMRELSEEAVYDGSINLFQSLGYFDDPDDDLLVCRNIQRSLVSGGWLVIEMDGKEALASSFEERTWLERDGRIILLEYAVEGAWDRLRNHWQFRDADGTWHETEFSYRLFSAVELGRLLESAGFASIEFFGGLDGRPYDHQARRLVALARKA